MKLFRRKTEAEKIIDYKFSDLSLLRRALTHPTAAKHHTDSYQRLEFLGDAILDFIVGEWLYRKYPDAPEGTLTELRRILVNTIALADMIKIIGLDRFVVYKKDEDFYLGSSVLADVYEAVVAAIYLDGGLSAARKFVQRTIIKYADVVLRSPKFINYKGRLLEVLQSQGARPRYVVLETTGPEHSPQFTVGVYRDEELLGIGVGSSKKRAEQRAASEALKKLESESRRKRKKEPKE